MPNQGFNVQNIMIVQKRKETGEKDGVPWWGEEKEEGKVRRKGGRGRGYRGLMKVKKGSSGCTRQPKRPEGSKTLKIGRLVGRGWEF